MDEVVPLLREHSQIQSVSVTSLQASSEIDHVEEQRLHLNKPVSSV